MYPERGLQIRHVVLVSWLRDFVVPRASARISLPGILAHAVKGQAAQPLGESGAVRCDHAAFPCRDVFRYIEAEYRNLAERADPAIAVLGTKRMRGILDDRKPVRVGDFKYCVHVA